MRNLSRLEKRTCLSSTCYRPSMVSNAFPDQSFSPCHHREIICSCIRTPTAPAVPRRYFFYAECPSLPSTVGFSRTPFSDCADSRVRRLLRDGCRVRGQEREGARETEKERRRGARCAHRHRRRFRDARARGTRETFWTSVPFKRRAVPATAASKSCPPNRRGCHVPLINI